MDLVRRFITCFWPDSHVFKLTDPGPGHRGRPLGLISLIFMQSLAKILLIINWLPHPYLWHHGSTTECYWQNVNVLTSTETCCFVSRCGGSRISQRGIPWIWAKKPIIWQNFYRKLHENERNWTGRGGASLPNLDPTVNLFTLFHYDQLHAQCLNLTKL